MSPYPLTNFEIRKYYQNEPKFNGVCSRNNWSKTKDGVCIKNRRSIETHWIALYVNDKNKISFDSFGVEHIPKEMRKFIGNRDIAMDIYRIQRHDSIMCGYVCIGFIGFMLKGKSLFEYRHSLLYNEYKKNEKLFL